MESKMIPQFGEQFEIAPNKVFMIFRGHIKLLIDKCHETTIRIHERFLNGCLMGFPILDTPPAGKL